MSKKRSFLLYLKDNWQLYIMILPALLLLFIFNYLPMYGITLAFKDYNPLKGILGSPGVGLKHFQTLFGDTDFLKVVFNTLRISFLRIVCGFPVPIILAILMNEIRSSFYKRSVQTIIYLPHFISWVIISGILINLLSSEGPINSLLKMFNIGSINFFGNSGWFLGTVIVSDIWKNAGWGTIIYFAAISNINPELYEAATVDGANRWQRIKNITFPGLVPAVSITLIFSLSGVLSAGFDQIFNMYNELVYDVADIIDTYVFRIGITDGRYGIATALGLFNSLVSLLLIMGCNKLIKKLGGVGIW